MALSEEIQDAITRHQIYVLRYSSGREQEASEYVTRIQEMIDRELEKDELSTMDMMRLRQFYDEVTEFANDTYSDLGEKIVEDLSSFLDQETEWNGSTFARFIEENIISPSDLDAQLAIFAGGLFGGLSGNIRNLIDRFRQIKVSQIVQNVTDGVTLRERNEQIKTRVQRVSGLQKKQVGTLIRTITNHTSVQSRDLMMRQNESLFDGYEWVAVLDSRTSLICASRDGTVYPFSDDPEKSPKPPAHFSCRSTITPVVKAQFEQRREKKVQRIAEGAKGKTKVRQTTTYQSWLKRQPASFQDEELGKSRGALFRRGKLPISKFVDRQGKTLTLDELRKVEPEVFNRLKL